MTRATLLMTLLVSAPTLAASRAEFVTIGNAGNRGATLAEVSATPLLEGVGEVGYEYRIARTELTAGDYLEFVRAYEPYWDGPAIDRDFIGSFIAAQNPFPGEGESAGYFLQPDAVNIPTDLSWEFAARYVNWLHNDQRPEREAFESGAYDTSTFITIDGVAQHQLTRSPGARFWIPSADELVKASYYDPNRYGPGEEGYWRYPDQGDEPLVPGVETNVSAQFGVIQPVGSFPEVQSFYGLLDGSGGMREWTETVTFSGRQNVRLTFGSDYLTGLSGFGDRVDAPSSGNVTSATGRGLRIALLVPSPSSAGAIALTLWMVNWRSKRCYKD